MFSADIELSQIDDAQEKRGSFNKGVVSDGVIRSKSISCIDVLFANYLCFQKECGLQSVSLRSPRCTWCCEYMCHIWTGLCSTFGTETFLHYVNTVVLTGNLLTVAWNQASVCDSGACALLGWSLGRSMLNDEMGS